MGWESSDLRFGPSFKVKQCFTGFGESSFQWIQICIGSLMDGASFVASRETDFNSKLTKDTDIGELGIIAL